MRQLTLKNAPGTKGAAVLAVIKDNGEVIGDGPVAESYRTAKLDMTLPPDERLLKLVGSPAMVVVIGPEDVPSSFAVAQQLKLGD